MTIGITNGPHAIFSRETWWYEGI